MIPYYKVTTLKKTEILIEWHQLTQRTETGAGCKKLDESHSVILNILQQTAKQGCIDWMK